MTHTSHLTEAERQGIADGSLSVAELDVERHLAECEACASDVAALRRFMSHVPAATSTSNSLDDLWPSIRARIEAGKVIPLDGAPVTEAPITVRRRRVVWIVGGIAAALAIGVVSLPHPRVDRGEATAASTADTMAEFSNVADSTNAYEAEATALINQLEIQRALMPPEARTSVDHDLRVIDDAIAEVKDALARDPNNPALRRLLASTYRQKVELLRRASGAG